MSKSILRYPSRQKALKNRAGDILLHHGDLPKSKLKKTVINVITNENRAAFFYG